MAGNGGITYLCARHGKQAKVIESWSNISKLMTPNRKADQCESGIVVHLWSLRVIEFVIRITCLVMKSIYTLIIRGIFRRDKEVQ